MFGKDFLRKRSDLSSFLVHLFSDYLINDAPQRLKNSLNNKKIQAVAPWGYFLHDNNCPKSICFTEAPLNQLKHIKDLSKKLTEYGLVFSKDCILNAKGNPTFYVSNYQNNNDIINSLKEIKKYCESNQIYSNYFQKIKPFIDSFDDNHNFCWEREWRIVEDFSFEYTDIVVGLCPEKDKQMIKYFKEKNIKHVDVNWSLDEMIFALK